MEDHEQIIHNEIKILSGMISEAEAGIAEIQNNLTRLNVVRDSLLAQLPEPDQLEFELDGKE